MPSYTFLSWCPYATAPINPITTRGKHVRDHRTFAAFFRENPRNQFILQRLVRQFCFSHRTDGLFLFHFVVDEGHRKEEEILLASTLIAAAIQEYLGYTHFFHPSPFAKSRSDYPFLLMNPIQICDLGARDITDGFVNLTQGVIQELLYDNDVHRRLYVVLSNDELLAGLASNTAGNVPGGRKILAALHLRAKFARSMAKMFALRERRAKFVQTNFIYWTVLMLIGMAIVFPYWRYGLGMEEEARKLIFMNQTLGHFFGALLSIPLTALSILAAGRIARQTLKKGRNISVRAERLIVSKPAIFVWVLMSFFYMFDWISILEPAMKYTQLNNGRIPWPSMELYKQIMAGQYGVYAFVPALCIFGLFLFFDVYWRFVAVINAAKNTIGVLHLGNIYSNVVLRLYRDRADWLRAAELIYRFDDAIDIVRLVISLDRYRLLWRGIVAILTAIVLLGLMVLWIMYGHVDGVLIEGAASHS